MAGRGTRSTRARATPPGILCEVDTRWGQRDIRLIEAASASRFACRGEIRTFLGLRAGGP